MVASKQSQDQELLSFQRKAEQIEAEKERKKRNREKKKREKERKKRRQKLEKLIAPILLFLTLGISFCIYFFSQ